MKDKTKEQLIAEIESLHKEVAELEREITERKKAEEALRRSEEKYRNLFENARDVMVTFDLKGNITSVNKAAAEYGFKQDELVGNNMRRFASRKHWPRLVKELAQIARGKPIEGEIELTTPKGAKFAEYRSNPIRKGKKVVGFQTILRDITERKWAEEERAKVEATLRSLNAAALAVQRTLSPDDIFSTVASELRKLGFLTTIFLLDEDQSNLMIAHISFSPELIKAAEKLTGLRLSNIRFPLDRIPQYIKEALGNRVTVFSQDKERVEGFLPGHLKGLVGKLVEILGLQKGIIAPLVVEDKVIGALAVDSKELTEKDIAAVTAFANQVSTAIENTRLYEAVQQELAGRKKAEEALRERERHFQALIENSSDIIQIVDSEGIIRYLSPSIQRILGYKPEELIGRPSIDVVHPDDLPLVAKGFEEALQKPCVPVITACRCKHKDGTWRVIEGTGINHLDNPSVNGFISNMHDITEREQAEQELRESEERYRALVEASGQMGEAIVLLQNTDKVEAAHLFANEAWTRMTGYTAEHLREISYFDLIHPRDRDVVADRVRRRLEGEHLPGCWEICIIDKDGREVPVEAAATPVTYQDRPAVVGYVRDISQRRKAKEEIEQQRNYFQALFDRSPEAVASLDAQNRVVGINPAFEKLFGYELEDIKGRDIDDCVVPRSRKEEGRSLARRALAGEVVAAESVRRRADGKEIPVSILTAPIILDGKQIGTFAIYRDITERKKAQEQLEHSFVNLAETVSRAMASRDPYTADHQRRVAELARLVGEKMGLDKDRLQGLYIGGLLHDIGKISTPGSILSKPGELTDEEWNLVRAHVKQGYLILKGTNLPWPVADMALHHHERLDGSGYPDGIGGDKLSLEVRILGVCDVVEAMSSHRPYRPARSLAEILKEIRGGRGTKYDANVGDIMLEMIESGKLDLSP